ncbi:putative phage-related Holin protein [Rhodovulum sulfidophilum]|uniref:Putative phage-related Holin protein n=1 Tax=Rhodovulum sulfidophilum TaxID=35806 RepID=A0A0D6B314_RHOSU|nr:putative phage-related Holin protein [Rhodovulum sulfidophilum]
MWDPSLWEYDNSQSGIRGQGQSSPTPRISPAQGDARAQERERERVKPWLAWYRTTRWSKLRRKILARAGHVCEQTGVPLLGRAPGRACSDAT